MKLTIAIAFMLLWASGGASGHGNGNLTAREESEPTDVAAANIHSRPKRYIVFPKGSSLQLLVELLVHVPTRFRVVVGPTLQVAWPLPSDPVNSFRSKRSFHSRSAAERRRPPPGGFVGKKHRMLSDVGALLDLFGTTVGLAWQLPDDPMIHTEFKKKHKIYKRNVFKKMEAFVTKQGGTNGRQCVLRALCESGQRTPSKKDFLTEILHKIFSMEAEEDPEDNHEDYLYRKAHLSVNQNCEALYPECHFSFFRVLE